MARRRPRLRPVMSGESVWETGATVRPTERSRLDRRPVSCRTGCRPFRHTEGSAVVGLMLGRSRAPCGLRGAMDAETSSSRPVGDSSGGSGSAPWVGGSESVSKSDEEKLHPSDPVGEGMVQLHHHGCTSTRQVLDEGELPQRMGGVEARHRRQAGHVDHGVGRVGWRGCHSPQVPGEIEVGIERPAGCRQATRRFHGALGGRSVPVGWPARGDRRGCPSPVTDRARPPRRSSPSARGRSPCTRRTHRSPA